MEKKNTAKVKAKSTTGKVKTIVTEISMQPGGQLVSFSVKGVVQAVDGSPLSGLEVRAFDKDMRREELLGEAQTDENGYYEIKFGKRVQRGGEILSIRVNKDLVLQIHPERSTLEASVGFERVPVADLGVTLVELLAYVGDQLAYYQDAVAAEAYLGTVCPGRLRSSIRKARKGLAALEAFLSESLEK